MNNSHYPALRRRRRCEAAPSGEAASWLHWKGKVSVLRLSAYILPAASRDTARRAWETPSCYYPQAKLMLMGGGRVLIVKVMVEGGRRSILAPAELGPGEMNACVNEGAGWWSSCRNARGRGWNRCREPRVTCNRKALITASRDVGGSRRRGRSAAEKRRD
jgi:hypothetical protein